ncbi:MAG TPA: hypothetical protein VJ020_02095 [Anaerolineales bacterium]|nr:hypothetical protein [Anaerolineales bacterium]
MQTESFWRNHVLWLTDILGTTVLTAGVVFLVVVACAILMPCDDGACLRSKNGDILAQAIDRFRDRTGRYPETLSELIPNELASLPTDPEDTDYGYWLTDNAYVVSYVWEFKSKDETETHIAACTFRSDQRAWNCYVD